MKKVIIYLILLLSIIAFYILAHYYRQSPPIYYVLKYNFEEVHKSLLKPTDEDIDKMNEYFYSRNSFPKRMDSLKYKILDSITNARITERDRYLAKLPIEKFVKEYFGDSLIFIQDKAEKEFIELISKINSYEQLPSKYKKNAEEQGYYFIPLYFNESEFPLKNQINAFENSNFLFFLPNGSYQTGILVQKWDKYYSKDELLDSWYSLHPPNGVPDKILYPYLSASYYLIPIFILVLLFPVFLKIINILFPKEKRDYYNPQKVVALTSLSICILAIMAFLSVFILEINIGKGGGAIFVFSLMLFFVGLIVMIMYLSRTASFDRIMKSTNNLVIWRYDEITWNHFIESDFQSKLQGNKSTLMLVGIIFFIILIIFGIIVEDAGETFWLIMLGIFSIITVVAFVAPKLSANRLRKSPPVCIIAKEGLILGWQFHNWTKFGSRIEDILIENEGNPFLLITYSYPARYGRQNYTIRVPIPPGDIEKAQEVAQKIANVGTLPNQ